MQVHLAVDEEQPLLGRKAEGRTFTTGRVAGAIAAVCGVVGLAALKRTSAGAPLLGAAKSADPFNDVLQRQSSQFEELAASRQEGIKMMAELQVYAFVHPEGISNLGASEYQTCVAPNSAPKNGYKKTDVGAIREDLVFATALFTTERNNAQPVTDLANSAAAVTSISCKAPPAIKFSDTKACAEDRGFCDNNCYMPVPDNCAEGKKNFGSCSPTVGSVCASITDVSDGCNKISEEINAERAKYTAMDPGASPCADTPGTPKTIASQKQAEYQTAHNMWAGAVNDATEVCTVGHGLLVHNEGMYDRHYAVMKEITADLKELCNQSNKENGANKFDFSAAVAEAQKNSIPTVRRRKLVWWQQLCDPTLASLEQITDSLEIASPQLQCFAEKCTEKKATEANAFEALKAAHNGYVSAFNTYKTKADAFNGYVDTKEEQKAGVIAKLESFHAGKQATSKIYARDKASFDRFDSGADAGHCGLTSCQVKTVCHAHIKDYFASFINPDTCQAVPMTVDQVCKGTTRVEDADAAKAAAKKAAAEAKAAAALRKPIFHFTFDESGDIPVNVIDGTPASCVGQCSLQYEDGKVGARALDTSNGAKVLMGPIDYSVTAHYSVCAWLKTNARIYPWQTAIGNWGKGYDIMHFGLDSGNNPEFADYSGATGKWNKLAAGPRGSFEVGRWTHVCEAISTGDGGKKQMWVDGKLTGEISNEGAPAYAQRQGTFNMVIGDKWEHGGNTWKGAIDDVMMWDFAITQEEVKAAFDGQPAASPAPAAPQIQRTRVGEFVGDNTRALKDAIKNCRGKFDTDPNCKINTWDVSKMTSLDWVFGDNTWFNENIGDWDVSNVRSFSHTFISAKSFSRCEISKWNVRAEGSMENAFYNCEKFNCDLNDWDVSKVNDFIQIFWNCPITIENTASWYDQTPVFAQTCKSYAPGGCPGNLNGRST
jgi:protein-tyrosine-phosphatase